MHELIISPMLLQATTNPKLYLMAAFLIYENKEKWKKKVKNQNKSWNSIDKNQYTTKKRKASGANKFKDKKMLIQIHFVFISNS